MGYQMDMNDEPKPKLRKLLPEGWRRFIIESCESAVSKSGNDMFIVELKDVETEYVVTIYPIAVQGKRWFLKQILGACGLDASKDGVYKWDVKDVINKEVLGLNSPEDNTWINREGEEVTTKQNRIVEIKVTEAVENFPGEEENLT